MRVNGWRHGNVWNHVIPSLPSDIRRLSGAPPADTVKHFDRMRANTYITTNLEDIIAGCVSRVYVKALKW